MQTYLVYLRDCRENQERKEVLMHQLDKAFEKHEAITKKKNGNKRSQEGEQSPLSVKRQISFQSFDSSMATISLDEMTPDESNYDHYITDMKSSSTSSSNPHNTVTASSVLDKNDLLKNLSNEQNEEKKLHIGDSSSSILFNKKEVSELPCSSSIQNDCIDEKDTDVQIFFYQL